MLILPFTYFLKMGEQLGVGSVAANCVTIAWGDKAIDALKASSSLGGSRSAS